MLRNMSVRPALLSIALGICLGLFEASFRSFLPPPFLYIRPLLPTIVLYIVLGRGERALWLGFIGGLSLELFGLPRGTLAEVRLPLIAWLLMLTSERVFTNASVYAAMATVCIARLLDSLWVVGVSIIRGGSLYGGFTVSVFWQTIAIDLLWVVILFIVQASLRKGWMVALHSRGRDGLS